MVNRREMLGGALACGALAALAGCSGGRTTAPGSEEVDVRPLTVGIMRPSSIDPAQAVGENSLIVIWQLFDSLMTYDFEQEELLCLAAESYELAEDALSCTFHLREATFHDGTSVTSRDFKRAWERIADPESAVNQAAGTSPNAYLLSLIQGYHELQSGAADGLAGVTCPDDSTLIVSFVTPYADAPYLFAHPLLGPVPASAERDADSFASQPVGNGPFMLSAAVTDTSAAIDLQRNEAYFGAAPLIEAARFQIVESPDASYQLFQTDDLDVSVCPIDEASDASSRLGRSESGFILEEGARFACVPGLTTSMLVCNCAVDHLTDAGVRRALSLAIDRDYLCDTLYRATRLAADGVIPPTVNGYREASWSCAAYDAARAAELLDTAGYQLDEDGTRTLTVTAIYNADGGHQEVMEAIAENLSDVGVACKLEPLATEAFQARLATGDFDLCWSDLTADAPTMDSVLFPLFFSSNVGSTNRSGFHSDHVDEQLAQARAETDEATRVALLQDADNAIGPECPVIPLMYHARSYAASTRIEYLSTAPQGRFDLATAEISE